MGKKEYVLDSLFEDIPKEDYNENWCEHKEQVRNMLQKGLYGFIGGASIFGFLQFMIYSVSRQKLHTQHIAWTEIKNMKLPLFTMRKAPLWFHRKQVTIL